MLTEDDNELRIVSPILSGEPNSAKLFYFKYYKRLKYFVVTRSKCDEDAEEIVQDIFLAAIESIGLYSGRSKLISWLYGIARHEISDYYRKKRVKTLVMSHWPMLAEILGDDKWAIKFNQIALRDQVQQVLGKILPRYAKVLKMKYLEGWRINDMSNELNESFKATETALFRARKAFAFEWNKLEES